MFDLRLGVSPVAGLAPPALPELAVSDPSAVLMAQVDARLAVDVLTEASRVVAQAQGLMLSMVASLAALRRTEAVEDAAQRAARGVPVFLDPVRDREATERFIGDEVAAALRLSPAAGYEQVLLADTLVTGAPTTFAALCQGRLDLVRATHRARRAAAALCGRGGGRGGRPMGDGAAPPRPGGRPARPAGLVAHGAARDMHESALSFLGLVCRRTCPAREP